MNPDDLGSLEPGRVYFGQPGASVEDLVPLGFVEATEAFSALGEAAERTGELLREFAESWTVEFKSLQFSSPAYRVMFGGRQPKAWRKRFVRELRQIRKRERREYRTQQRRAIGIKEES